MVLYCKKGDKPIIKYRFQGDIKDRIRKVNYAPIDITTKPIPVEGTGSYLNDGFQITYASNSCRGLVCVDIVHDYVITRDSTSTLILKAIYCGSKKFSSGIPLNRGDIVPGQLVSINNSIKCPTPNSQRCSIIAEYNGMVVFSDQGNCPVNLSVQCGKCPGGQHECESNIYPYYCCNSCADTARKINNIANKIRGY